MQARAGGPQVIWALFGPARRTVHRRRSRAATLSDRIALPAAATALAARASRAAPTRQMPAAEVDSLLSALRSSVSLCMSMRDSTRPAIPPCL